MTNEALPIAGGVPECAGCDPASGRCHVFDKAMPASHFELCRTRADLRALWARRAAGEATCKPAEAAKPNALLGKLREKNGGPTSDPVPDCACGAAGFCTTFGRQTTEAGHRLCRTSPEERWKLAGERGPKPSASPPRVDAPCVHRSREPVRAVRCRLCGQRDRFVQIHACNNPEVAASECAVERYQVGHDPNFECCNGCEKRSAGAALSDYRDKWQTFRDEFYEAAATLPEPPEWEEGRAVVVCGGWGRFFPSLYVSLSMIRRTGFSGPLQVWGLGSRGELDPRAREICAHLGAEWFDGEAVAREPEWSMKRCNGWELKALALAACRFREVALFDADAYPLTNPAELFDLPRIAAAGAYFTQDASGPEITRLKTESYNAFGLPNDGRPAWESGQLLVDKGRHWRAVRLALWLNSESERTYERIYGDKDTFHLAWQKTQSTVLVSARPEWRKLAFVHKLPDGSPFTVHRCQCKFRVGEGQRFMSPQKGVRCDELPLEAEAWAFYEECVSRLRTDAIR